MTNKEANEVLEQMRANICNDYRWLALDLAIKALKERPHGEWIGDTDYDNTCKCSKCRMTFDTDRLNNCPNCGSIIDDTGMSELIDRQDVIDRLKKAEDVFRQNGAKLEANGIHYALELVESDIEIPTSEGLR